MPSNPKLTNEAPAGRPCLLRRMFSTEPSAAPVTSAPPTPIEEAWRADDDEDTVPGWLPVRPRSQR